jgi:two-component system, NtrC family, sensor kinase
MATRGRKPAKRTTAPKRPRPIRKPKSVQPKSGLSKSGLSKSAPPKSGKRVSGKSKSETARLKSQLRIAQDRQTASAEILRTIGNVSDDAERSLQQIAETTKRLFKASSVSIFVAEGDEWGQVVHEGPSSKRVGAEVSATDLRMRGRSLTGATFSENRQIHLPDIDNVGPSIAHWAGLAPARAAGTRTLSGTPLRRAGQAIGVLIVHRDRLAPFAADELNLLQIFADQAAIAIHNVRLFNETKEALEQQTAISDVLRVISSSPGDVGPVFASVAEHAARICEAEIVDILTIVDDRLQYAAEFGEFGRIQPGETAPLNRDSVMGRSICDKQPVHVVDLQSTDHDFPLGREYALALGHRTTLAVPLIREACALGTILVRRAEVRPFDDRHVALLKTFADQAAIAIENARLLNELRQRTDDLSESLQQQTATADVLKVISRSAFELEPVLKALVESAARLCEADKAFVYQRDADMFRLAATHGFPADYEDFMKRTPVQPGRGTLIGRTTLEAAVVHIPDCLSDAEYSWRESQERGGYRTMLGVPLLREGVPIGVLAMTRSAVKPFTDKQIELVTTFADQAVIAIENVRLFNETQEALERQTATADILKVIASSPSDVQPVFDAIAASANALLGGFSTAVFRFVDDIAHLAAFTPTNPAADSVLQSSFPMPLADFEPFELAKTGQPVEITDTEQMPNRRVVEIARMRGFRSMLFVPLMNSDVPIGLISVTRTETGSFADNHVQLLQTFADQAVIAIENVRLFEEVQAKTRDLTESLQQQIATAEVLKVISASPGKIDPVFDKILASARQLCDAKFGHLLLFDGESWRAEALHNVPEAHARFWKTGSVVAGPETNLGRVQRSGKPDQVADVRVSSGYLARSPLAVATVELAGARTLLTVPLLKEGRVIGGIAFYRTEVRPFDGKQIELLSSFADQAVIAIENARLFEAEQARTRELTVSLQQQTATADVLKVISRSAFDLQRVLDTLAESACRLCNAYDAVILLREGEFLRIAAHYGEIAVVDKWPVSRAWISGRAVLDRMSIHIHDLLAEEAEYPMAHAFAQQTGHRTLFAVPLMREQDVIGAITIRRTEVRPFTDKQIELVSTFADQAVIAIENVRLFNEVQARTRELAASLDDLRAAQDRLIQTEKLASLGQLTAGIAHEIKNPLNFVNNFSALSAELTDELNDALKPVALEDKLRKEIDELTAMLKDNLEKVVQHGKRADSIVKNMLLHSRESSGERRPADVNALLDESLNLAYHGARAEKSGFNITLQRDFDADAGEVELFPQEITRALLNVISNGFYAATRRKAENDDSGFEPVLAAATRNLGDSVEIRIRDNGTGIPLEVREKMFNPFFTTKPAGEGTGLGLSMSHDIIVKQHGGSIDIATEAGEFTELRIILPRGGRR